MKHRHHIIPKHMNGTDDPDNIIFLSVEEHAEAHRVLYEQYGNKEDYLAWQGLAGIMTKKEIVLELLSLAGKKGAKIANDKRWKNHIKKVSKYDKNVDGRKVRTLRYWYNNDIEEGQFELDSGPIGWKRGRLKSVMLKARAGINLSL